MIVAVAERPTVAPVIGKKGTCGGSPPGCGGQKPVFPISTVFHTLSRIGSMLGLWHLLDCQPLSDMSADPAVPQLNRSNVYRLKFPCPTWVSFQSLTVWWGVFGGDRFLTWMGPAPWLNSETCFFLSSCLEKFVFMELIVFQGE